MKTKPFASPAEQARVEAGLTTQEVARRLGLRSKSSPRYVRQLELHGGAPLHVAKRWGRIVGADPNLLFHTARYQQALERRRSSPPVPIEGRRARRSLLVKV